MFKSLQGVLNSIRKATQNTVNATTRTTRTVREFGPDGKVIKETTETTETPPGAGPVDNEAAEAASKEVDKQFAKMGEFFSDMDKAFGKFFK